MKLFFQIACLMFVAACSTVVAQENAAPFQPAAFEADLARLAQLAGDSDAFEDEAGHVMMKLWPSIYAPDTRVPLADVLAFAQKIDTMSDTVPKSVGWTYIRVLSFTALCQELGRNTAAKTSDFGPTLKNARDLLDGLEAEFIALGGRKAARPLGNYNSLDQPKAEREAKRKAVSAHVLLMKLPELRQLLLQQCLKTNPGGSRKQLAAKLTVYQFTPAQIRAVLEDVPVRHGK